MKQLNINELFDIAFGIKSVGVFKVDGQESKNGLSFNYSGVEVTDDINEASRMSYLGTPMIIPMTLKGKKYQVYNAKGEIEDRDFADFEMPAATLVNFRRAKIIAKTKALASSGTVKELYGFDDWQIDIRGFCLKDPSHPNAQSAKQQIKKLLEFEKIVDSIRVFGALFKEKGIDDIVIQQIDIIQLKCVSDQPIELFL
jgi:hypothetical protein